jgi:hypothetical protein
LEPEAENTALSRADVELVACRWVCLLHLTVIIAFKLISFIYHRAMVWGGTLITPQALEWGISINKSATSMNWGILLQGFGGIFAVPLVEAYGRYVEFSLG